jgi:hypothetical protein
MKDLQRFPFRSLAILLVAIPLAACMTPSDANPTPVATTPAIATAAPEPTEAPVAEATQAATSVPEQSAPLDPEWVQEAFGDAWSIGYPAAWSVNDAGAHEGALQLEGEYAGHSYAVTFSYPIGIAAATLDAWIDELVAALTPEQQQAVVVSDITVANTPAKKVLNFPSFDGASTAHHLYIWRAEGKNPRLITITQTDGQPLDTAAMEQLLDRFAAAVQ